MPNLPRDFQAIDPALRRLLRDLANGKAKWPLFLYGLPGRGKTCACLAMADITFESYYTTAKQATTKMLERVPWYQRLVKERALLIVDEVGKVASPGWLQVEGPAIKDLADIREHKPTIWISNYKPAEVAERYGDLVEGESPIISRIACGEWFELTGPDRRMEE